jgi:hypothetical protein
MAGRGGVEDRAKNNNADENAEPWDCEQSYSAQLEHSAELEDRLVSNDDRLDGIIFRLAQKFAGLHPLRTSTS